MSGGVQHLHLSLAPLGYFTNAFVYAYPLPLDPRDRSASNVQQFTAASNSLPQLQSWPRASGRVTSNRRCGCRAGEARAWLNWLVSVLLDRPWSKRRLKPKDVVYAQNPAQAPVHMMQWGWLARWVDRVGLPSLARGFFDEVA